MAFKSVMSQPLKTSCKSCSRKSQKSRSNLHVQLDQILKQFGIELVIRTGMHTGIKLLDTRYLARQVLFQDCRVPVIFIQCHLKQLNRQRTNNGYFHVSIVELCNAGKDGY